MAAMFKSIKTVNRLADEKRINRGDASKILEVLRSIDSVLGFLNFEAVRYDAEIQRLIDARNKAWMRKDTSTLSIAKKT